jgi:hypothetical protein
MEVTNFHGCDAPFGERGGDIEQIERSRLRLDEMR